MDARRVAVIYDDRPRPETTGVYCRRALEGMASVTHLLPEALESTSANDFDLFLSIDDGLPYEVPDRLRPSAWWAIDTHLDFDRCLRRAHGADLVFAAQRSGAERLRRAGIDSAAWLPLACDPSVHRPHLAEKQFDVCFVGNVFPGPRQELLDAIQRRFSRTFVGRRYFDEMARTYSASRVVFNRSVADDVNMRVFEALACGGFLLTNDLPESGQDELFRDGKHLRTYRGVEELLDRLEFYVLHDDERQRIVAAGLAEVVGKHTYAHRMQEVLRAAVWIARRPSGTPANASTNGKHTKPTTPDLTYYDFERPELLALVPTTARRVLEIGCGTGRLGASIKVRQGAHITGIELDERAADIARQRLDQVLHVDAESDGLDFPPSSFDCILCGDVLEHLRAPDRLLRQVRGWLAPEGVVVASLPNVRHHSVISSLLAGNWTYEPAGLLDKTHLRFFTRREIEKLFDRAGFAVDELQVVPGSGYREWAEAGRPGEVKVGHLHIGGLRPADAEEFFAYQWLLVAKPAVRRHEAAGLTSIVLVTWNEVGYTRLCLDTIRLFTDEPYELIVVDNGSTDGTVEYLRECRDVRLIENGTNRGFPAAANQGIHASQGAQVLLLNNDTMVTTGWLRRQLDALYRQPQTGLVGPCSNNVSGEQQIPVNYPDLSYLDGFAWDWGESHDGETVETDRLVGFCLLIRREVIERVGLLDERFGIGNFEDDDYCRRARATGYKLMIARDAFVHHFGSRTFVGSGTDLGSLLRKNEQVYREKWDGQPERSPEAPAAAPPPAPLSEPTLEAPPAPPAAPVTVGPERDTPRPAHSFTVEVSKSGALRLVAKEMRLSLAMIVRDNASTIEAALTSIKPWVDEMVVVDTGSKDATPEICRRLGARVFHFAWCDSFAAARNESLRHCRGEWIFWMDSDDVIDADNGQQLRQLARREPEPNALGYVMTVRCPAADEQGQVSVTAVHHCKLFRNRPDLRFEFRIHEQILGAIRRAGGEVQFTDLFVTHANSDQTAEGRERKLERDMRLLKLELHEKYNHPFVLFNLGMTYADAGQHDQAIAMLRRSIDVAENGESHLRKAYALLIGSYLQLDRRDEAWQACQAARRLFPKDPELLFREGILCHHFGRLAEAEAAYLGALANDDAPHFSSVDQGILGYKTRHNLALVYTDMQDEPRAEEQWQAAVAESPGYRDGWQGLGDSLLAQGKLDELATVAHRLAGDPWLRPLGQTLLGRLAEARGDGALARRTLEAAVHENPTDAEPLRALCQTLYFRATPEEAADALRELVRRAPGDAAAHHNLATVRMRQGRYREAADEFAVSLRLRPDAPHTRQALAWAEEALRGNGTNGTAAV